MSTERPPVPASALPVVARRSNNRSLLLFGVAALIAAALLFQALEARRVDPTAPAVRAPAAELAAAPSPPPMLYIPPDPVRPQPAPRPVVAPRPDPVVPPPPVYRQPLPPADPAPRTIYVEPPGPAISTAPVMVIGRGPAGNASASASQTASPSLDSEGRPVQSARPTAPRRPNGRIANPGSTVAQGTLIPAVLETGLDSSRPGQARALVSRSVRSFDGKTILIPRGSRLYGEYRADATPGQSRALIQWTRLLLPDGVTVYLDSPVSDPMGRAGVKGSVNSHFFERFAGSILQTALNIGTGLATRRLYEYPVVLAIPGGQVGGGGPATPGLIRDIPPTIKVKPGARISVFVAQDLDFTGSTDL
jgi:type IV secretion system protein VirB10